MNAPEGLGRAPNYIEHTWLAWAHTAPAEATFAERALARVTAHYEPLYEERLVLRSSAGERTGLALLTRPDERLRWPLWTEGDGLAAAYTTAPTGWGDLVTEDEPASAALALARRLRDDADPIARLNSPFLLGIREATSERLVICNDFIGTARLYTLEAGGLRVWSNRLAALVIFAGVEPRVDVRAWAVLAATGWFLGSQTAIEGAAKVPAASVVDVRPSGDGVEVRESRVAAALALVTPRDADVEASADAAATATRQLARDVDRNWDVVPDVDLSGGNDSRISAAGFVATGVPARFQTVDLEPGELDLARELLRRVPRPMEHLVRSAESPREDDVLGERVRDYHLVHDGMLNPHSLVRGPLPLPARGFEPPIVSGHGGEVGHGFYYGGANRLRRAENADLDWFVEKLEKASRRRRDVAREEGYAAFREEARRALEEGRERGLDGAGLFDFYYLTQRLAFRSGLGARNDRHSACATPDFVRACFDLSPVDRLHARLHPLLVERLVPEWSDVPIFESQAAAPVLRSRLWERPHHREQLGEIVAAEETWSDVFEPEQVREMWRRVLDGEGRPHDERVLTRLASRAGFEAHLRTLGRAASA